MGRERLIYSKYKDLHLNSNHSIGGGAPKREFRVKNPIPGTISEGMLNEIYHEVAKSTIGLRGEAIDNAHQRSDHSDKSETMIVTSIDKCFTPHVFEIGCTTKQLATREYQIYASETRDFMPNSVLGYIFCTDDRILGQAIADPQVVTGYKRPQGLAETRASTKTGADLPNDFDLVAGAETKLEILGRKIGIKNVELIEFAGPHIDSVDPVTKGCGVAKLKATEAVAPEKLIEELEQGYLKQFYHEQGDRFHALDNLAKSLGAKSTTVDYVFDTHDQSAILGLRKEHKNFLPDLTLRENLLRLAEEKKILMTELLSQDVKIHDSIWDIARSMGQTNFLDVQHFSNFANNAIIIGRVARELTIRQQKEGFNFIPKSIKDDLSPEALLAIAYHTIRNAAYLVLGGIQPGAHFARHHLAKLVRVGPIGGKHFAENPSLIQNIPHGGIGTSDLQQVPSIVKIAKSIRQEQGADLEKEGIVILSTGAYNDKRYANENIALEEWNLAKRTVRNNAASIRRLYDSHSEIKKGKIIVLGCIYNQDTNELTSVV